MRQMRPAGPRCSVCNRPYQPRQLRDGTMSQTCGQTACVASHTRRKNAFASASNRPRPQTAW